MSSLDAEDYAAGLTLRFPRAKHVFIDDHANAPGEDRLEGEQTISKCTSSSLTFVPGADVQAKARRDAQKHAISNDLSGKNKRAKPTRVSIDTMQQK